MNNLDKLYRDLTDAENSLKKLKSDMPRIAGNEATKIVKQNFPIQGYDSGLGIKAWEARKAATDKAYDAGRSKGKQGNYKGSVFSSTNPLLEQTRRLYNSIKYKVISKSVIIGVDILLVPYAQRMNEGGDGTPARQYMPTPQQPANKKMKKVFVKVAKQRVDDALKIFKK